MLIFFSQHITPLSDQYVSDFEVKQFHNFIEWQNERIKPSAFVVVGSDADYVTSIIGSIRRDDHYFASLCFSTETANDINNQLSDGLLPEPENLKHVIAHFTDLETSFKHTDGPLSYLDRLIKYLWVRPDFVLQPCYEWQQARSYCYPLLDALSLGELEAFGWLRNLENRKILESAVLVDRQMECKFCSASHLAYIDVCPNCHSKDINLQASLHCFTCGHVDVQEKFIQTGSLVCPNCHTQLRHIGSDYDRPIENHRCQSCNNAFIDGEVVSRCAVCRKEMSPNDLVSNRIYSWKLSNRGRVIAVRGMSADLSASFDHIDFISEEIFTFNLDWFLIMSRRYSNIHFSLLGIYFANLTELSEVVGHTKLFRILEAFSQRLRGLLRNTDLTTRTTENTIWLLLPNTDEPGLERVHERVEENLQLLLEDSDKALDYRFVSAASTQIPKEENADLLLARLYGQLR